MCLWLPSFTRERSAALVEDGTAWCWGGIKRLGATLPPGYPADLCTTNATEIGHNRYAQPIPQALNPAVPEKFYILKLIP